MSQGNKANSTGNHLEQFIENLLDRQGYRSIEAKWQQTSGSVDEKYPYLIQNIMLREYPTIIVLDGGGYKPEAEKWLRQLANPTSWLIHVFSMSELQKFVNDGKV